MGNADFWCAIIILAAIPVGASVLKSYIRRLSTAAAEAVNSSDAYRAMKTDKTESSRF
jgi:hypothetical protein